MRSLAKFLLDRIERKSVQAAIIAGISSAALLPTPWCWIVSGLCVTFALIPTKKKQDPCECPEAPKGTGDDTD